MYYAKEVQKKAMLLGMASVSNRAYRRYLLLVCKTILTRSFIPISKTSTID